MKAYWSSSFLQQRSPNCSHTNICVILFALLLVVLLFFWRLTLGIDHSDESYYAIAPVSWTRSTPVETGNFSIHQFSGCITYPFVQAYALLNPQLHGLILFLRCIYGIASLTTAFFAWILLRSHFTTTCSILLSLLVVLFIPFGLPAPSYNTLGALGCLSGLFLVLSVLENRRSHVRRIFERSDLLGCFASALALSMGIVAHPILIFLFPVMGLLLVIAYRIDLRLIALWAFSVVVIGLFMGLLAIHHLGGIERVRSMLAFVGSFDNTLGGVTKARLAFSLLLKDQAYCLALVTLATFGCISAAFPTRLISISYSLALALASIWCVVRWTGTPVLFGRGHDLIFLLSVASIPSLLGIGINKFAKFPLFSVIFAVGMTGGLLIGYSATHSLYNFPLMGIACVMAGFGIRAQSSNLPSSSAETILAAVVCSMLGFASYQQVYGEGTGTHLLTHRITRGPFAGLLTKPAKAALMSRMDAAILSIPAHTQTLECLGRLPGIYLHTPYKLRSPFPYPLDEKLTTRTVPFLKQWYGTKSYRADCILWFRDSFPLELNHVQTGFVADHYKTIHDDGQGITVLVPSTLAE